MEKINILIVQIALRLDEDIDFDVDNPLVKRFIDKYIVSCGAVSGRGSNPSSHYLWKGKLCVKHQSFYQK
jgi:hypothetical protein